MEDIKIVSAKINKMKQPIESACIIKKYLKTTKKFEFVELYKKILDEHKNDYKGMIDFIGFVYFHILLVKYYTNINVDFTYDCFDELMENNIIDNVVAYIQSDYSLLLRFCNLRLNEKDDV